LLSKSPFGSRKHLQTNILSAKTRGLDVVAIFDEIRGKGAKNAQESKQTAKKEEKNAKKIAAKKRGEK